MEKTRRLTRLLLTIGFLGILAVPVIAFFANRGGLAFLAEADFRTVNLLLFPLVGLMAFTLVWLQVMMGSTMDVLRKWFPKLVQFHRRQGIVALVFALTHPTMILVGYGPAMYYSYGFVAPHLKLFVWLGYLQLFLLVVTAGSALLLRWKWFRTRWRRLHYLNYAVFVSVWVHSWFLGSDIQGASLRSLWYFFGVSAVTATALRIVRQMQRVRAQRHRAVAESYTPVARTSEIREGVPYCLRVQGEAIALFKVRGNFFALHNACPHAGGPLCEGTQLGPVITCPWHGSKFAVTTGAVVGPPARAAQRTYPVRVVGDRIEIAVS